MQLETCWKKDAINLLQHQRETEVHLNKEGQVGPNTGHAMMFYAVSEFR